MLQDPAIEESQEIDEDDLDEWQEIAENVENIVILKSVIEDFSLVEPENEEDKLPEQLLEVGNTILNISLGIESVKSHKEDIEKLLADASALVIVFWRIHQELGIPGTMWPPPVLRNLIDKLVNTVYYIYKYMKRKSQKNVAKRILVGYFGLRDLGKSKKYQRRLGFVASGLESEPHNIKINALLLETIENQTHELSEESAEEAVEEPVRKNKRAVHPAGRFRSRKGKAKQTEAEDSSEEEENRPVKKRAGRQPETRPEPKGTKGAKNTRHSNSDEETIESKDKGKRSRYQESDEDMGEGTSRQGSRTTNATRSKTKQRASPANEEEECNTDVPASDPVAQRDQPKKKKPVPNSKQKVKSTPVSQSSISGFSFHRGNEDNMDVPVSDTVAPKGLPKKKKNRPAPTPRQKVESTPVSQTSISGFSFHNESGNMANVNVGNIYNSSITDAYNDNSVNVHGRWKPA